MIGLIIERIIFVIYAVMVFCYHLIEMMATFVFFVPAFIVAIMGMVYYKYKLKLTVRRRI